MGMRDHIPGVARSRIGSAGRASEKRVAKSLGARLRPNSGAVAGAKGDFKSDDFLFEAKSTTGDSIQLKYEWLGKISMEAMQAGRPPAMTISFTWPNGRAVDFGDWVLIPKRVFDELVQP